MGAMNESSGPSAPTPTGAGVRAVTSDTFSLAQAVGGVRGLAESVAPGLVFVVAFVATQDLTVSVVASVAAALVATAARLVQRTPVTQALGGLLGVGVGVVWAWRSGEAENFYAGGLLVNAGYLVVLLGSILLRKPLVGYVVEALRTGWSPQQAKDRVGTPEATSPALGERPASDGDDEAPSPFAGLTAWVQDRAKVRRYSIATWFWVGMFALRLAVKTPLYFAGDVAWLGTFHLVLGVPLWALVLFLTWVVVRDPR